MCWEPKREFGAWPSFLQSGVLASHYDGSVISMISWRVLVNEAVLTRTYSLHTARRKKYVERIVVWCVFIIVCVLFVF